MFSNVEVAHEKGIIVIIIYRGANELRNLHYLPRTSEPREVMVEDRTRCHADHVGQGPDRLTTAAVGVLKGVSLPDE